MGEATFLSPNGKGDFLVALLGAQGGRHPPLYAFRLPNTTARKMKRKTGATRKSPLPPAMPDQGRAKTKSVEPARKSSVSGQSWGIRPATADPQPDGVAMYWRPATE